MMMVERIGQEQSSSKRKKRPMSREMTRSRSRSRSTVKLSKMKLKEKILWKEEEGEEKRLWQHLLEQICCEQPLQSRSAPCFHSWRSHAKAKSRTKLLCGCGTTTNTGWPLAGQCGRWCRA